MPDNHYFQFATYVPRLRTVKSQRLKSVAPFQAPHYDANTLIWLPQKCKLHLAKIHDSSDYLIPKLSVLGSTIPRFFFHTITLPRGRSWEEEHEASTALSCLNDF